MNLQHLCSAPHVDVYFDSWNNWLYVDWSGELTLPVVQHACLEIANCYLQHAYPRVLNNNAQVTSIGYDVPEWLANNFIPYLTLAGVNQMAWVTSPSVRGRDMAINTLSRLPHLAIALFEDVEQAVTWLQHTRPAHASGVELLPRPLPPGTTLAGAVRSFTRLLAGSTPADAATLACPPTPHLTAAS